MSAAIVVLAVLLLALIIALALLGAVALRRTARPSTPPPLRPSLGSPAQVLLERGERVGKRLNVLGSGQPLIAGACDDAEAVVGELRAAAARTAALDKLLASVPVPTLRGRRSRLESDIAQAAGTPAEADLRAARDSVAAQLATAVGHQAARDTVLARMRAAVAGLEQAEAELTTLLTEPTAGAAPAGTATTATTDLEDRLAGLRAGLAEVRAIGTLDVDPAQAADQGLPGDLPGSVEPPPRT